MLFRPVFLNHMPIALLGTGLPTTLNLSVPPATVAGNGHYHVALTVAISGGLWLLRGDVGGARRQILGGRTHIRMQVRAMMRLHYPGCLLQSKLLLELKCFLASFPSSLALLKVPSLFPKSPTCFTLSYN